MIFAHVTERVMTLPQRRIQGHIDWAFKVVRDETGTYQIIRSNATHHNVCVSEYHENIGLILSVLEHHMDLSSKFDEL